MYVDDRDPSSICKVTTTSSVTYFEMQQSNILQAKKQ